MSLDEHHLAAIRERFQHLDEHHLAAIRERFQHLDMLNDAENPDDDRYALDKALRVAAWSCAWDVGPLLAEVDSCHKTIVRADKLATSVLENAKDEDEMGRIQEGWDAAKDEIDRLRARVAELEGLVGADMEKAWRQELVRVELMAMQRGRIQDLCRRTAVLITDMAHFGLAETRYVRADTILEALEYEPPAPDTPASLAARFAPGELAAQAAVDKAEREVLEASKAGRDELQSACWRGYNLDALLAAVDALAAAERASAMPQTPSSPETALAMPAEARSFPEEAAYWTDDADGDPVFPAGGTAHDGGEK